MLAGCGPLPSCVHHGNCWPRGNCWRECPAPTVAPLPACPLSKNIRPKYRVRERQGTARQGRARQGRARQGTAGYGMAHRYAEAIRVTVADGDHAARPTTFTWRGRRHVVEVIGSWHLCARWWDAGAASDRTYYHVLSATQGVYELAFDAASRVWVARLRVRFALPPVTSEAAQLSHVLHVSAALQYQRRSNTPARDYTTPQHATHMGHVWGGGDDKRDQERDDEPADTTTTASRGRGPKAGTEAARRGGPVARR